MTPKKKLKKILKTSIKWMLSIIAVLLLIVLLSIPYGKYSEKEMKLLGTEYQNIALQGVHVISMGNDSIMYNKYIYIEQNNIVAITPDTVLREGYNTINAKGKYVMPGLIDMHAHVFDRSDLAQYLAYGVTTVRNMMGFPMHLRWKQQLAEGKLIGSQLITATPTLNSGDDTGPFHKTVFDAEEAGLAVDNYISAGYDFIKVYDNISATQFDAIEYNAQANGVQIAGHPPQVSLERLLSSSIASIEHTEELLQFLDEERTEASIRALARQIKASDKAVTLNLVAFNRIYRISQEGLEYYHQLQEAALNPITKFIGTKQLEVYTKAGPQYKAYTEAKYKAMETLSRVLVEEDVTVLFGTDSGPNFLAAGASVMEELQLLKAAGLSEYEVLKSATYSAAEVLGMQELGRIETNALANVIVLNDNPLTGLQTVSQPYMLIANNRYYNESELAEVKRVGEEKQNTYATLGLFLEHLLFK